MKKAKQVIVMRNDFNMRKGKMVAQGSHASLGVILGMMGPLPGGPSHAKQIKCLRLSPHTPIAEWINGTFTKICVRVESEEELFEIEDKAIEAGLPVKLITDSGLTEFDGQSTNTCLAIGPAWSDEIDAITGHLKLL